MSVKIDESAYRTLTLFFLSCRPTVGDLVLERFFSYKGPFPVTFEEILGDLSWIIVWTPGLKKDEEPDNVFYKIISYGEEIEIDILTSSDIYIFFGNKEHLKTAKLSCTVFEDITLSQRNIAHMVLPLRVTMASGNIISGVVTYNNFEIRNVYNSFDFIKVGDIVLVHFANVVALKPRKSIIDYLTKIQEDLLSVEFGDIKSIEYSKTYEETKTRIEKLFNHS